MAAENHLKIFLTGGTGFLGSHTAEKLVERGHQVTALVRKTSNIDLLKKLQVSLVEGQLPECGSLSKHIDEVDVIIHIAGIIKALSKEDFFNVNAKGTENLVREVLRSSKKARLFLHISTIGVHNKNDSPDFCLPPEQCHPLSHYGESKKEAELALRPLFGKMRVLVLRPPVLYGPRDLELLPLFKAIQHGIAPLYRDGTNRFSICYAEDVANAICRLIESEHSKDDIFCLDDGKAHTWRSLAGEIAKLFGKEIKYIPIPYPLFYLGASVSQTIAKIRKRPDTFTINKLKEVDQKDWVCGSEKLQINFGWKAEFTTEEGLRNTFAYYKKKGLL